MSVAWRLQLIAFDGHGGFLVTVSARRSDFSPYRLYPDDSRTYVFETSADATAGGLAVFRAYSGPHDVLLPVRGKPGEMLDWKHVDERARALRAKTPDEWRAFLRTFKTWETSGDPDKPVRTTYNVLLSKNAENRWQVMEKEVAPW